MQARQARYEATEEGWIVERSDADGDTWFTISALFPAREKAELAMERLQKIEKTFET